MRSMQRFARARALPHVGAAFQLFALLLAGSAEADPGAEDRALATALFQEGRALMSEGRIAEACPKLAESHRLDPSGGTILNLALCHEQEGLLARSWSEFHEAISFARRDARSDREQAAESHVRALEPRLSKLTIVVPESARVDGLRIERDGRELGQASWSTAMPVDAGKHTVWAGAPGMKPFTTTIVIGAESDAQSVEVPRLTAAQAAPPAVAIASAPAESSPPVPAAAVPGKDRARGGTARRAIAWSLGGAGLVQWGAAGYFGLRAFRKHADSNSACPDGHCTPHGVALNDESRRAADTSTVLAITGLTTIAASVYLLLTSPTNPGVALRSRVPPRFALGTSGSTVLLQSRF